MNNKRKNFFVGKIRIYLCENPQTNLKDQELVEIKSKKTLINIICDNKANRVKDHVDVLLTNWKMYLILFTCNSMWGNMAYVAYNR